MNYKVALSMEMGLIIAAAAGKSIERSQTRGCSMAWGQPGRCFVAF